MDFKKASSTSTPNQKLRARPSIHNDDNEFVSPIGYSRNPEGDYSDDENIPNSDSSSDLSEKDEKENSNTKNETNEEEKPQSLNMKLFAITMITLVVAALISQCWSIFVTSPKLLQNLTNLRNTFPSQVEETWIAIESGVFDTKRYNRPSVFLIAYNNNSEITVNSFVTDVSRYASNILNDGNIFEPIILTVEDFKVAQDDYGIIIDKFRYELDQKGVLVVKNLEKLPGKVAQAFHSICDEFEPLVEKSVVFFTMELPNFSNKNLQTIEKILRKNWFELDDDIFHPLFTRISSMVLTVISEDNT